MKRISHRGHSENDRVLENAVIILRQRQPGCLQPDSKKNCLMIMAVGSVNYLLHLTLFSFYLTWKVFSFFSIEKLFMHKSIPRVKKINRSSKVCFGKSLSYSCTPAALLTLETTHTISSGCISRKAFCTCK